MDSYWNIVICIAAGLLLLAFLLVLNKLLAIKAQMKKMSSELANNRDMDYNKQVRISLIDKDLTKLATEYNKSLDYQKELKLSAEHSRKQLQQSISDIAHDLRTPITVMKGNLQRMVLEEKLSEAGKEYVRICFEKTEVLREMVDDFFELSFYESEMQDVSLKKIDLTAFAIQFFVDQEAVIRDKNMEPDICIPEKSLFIMAEEQFLSRVFGNLLNNILKHSKDTFSFSLKEVQFEEKACIQIDFANPIERDKAPDVAHIFERTYRGDKSRTGGGVGGLGLYIVQLLSEKQGARVDAQLLKGESPSAKDILKISVIFER